jgi:hypothetical protein
MNASLLNTLKKVPAPLFGSAAVAVQFGARKASAAPRFAPWALPAIAGGLWFVWPAVDEEWKKSVFGSSSSSESTPAPETKPEIELDQKVMDKVEKAYVVEEKHLTEQEKNVVKAIGKGDFSELEKEWDNFQIKAENPEEDEVSLHNPFLSYQSYISFSTHFLYFVHPG